MIAIAQYYFGLIFGGLIVFALIAVLIPLLIKGYQQRKFLGSGINEVDHMTGLQFEIFLQAHFCNLGYKVNVTKQTSDYGADLILKKGAATTVVQAKRWKGKVGIKAVQELIGAIQYYKANDGIVVCNNYFTKNAINLASSASIELWNRDRLLNIMAKANGKKLIENLSSNQVFSDEYNKCPDCGGELQKRKGKYGEFLGCNNYPKCTYTRKIGGK